MTDIDSWAKFESRIRNQDKKLLAEIDCYENPVLVAGVQRSGTTILTRILAASAELGNYRFTHDDELDAALLLCGHLPPLDGRRYAFQTTYLNDSFGEYFEHDNFKLVWVLREPQAVVHSMLHNWKTGALTRLFRGCGVQALDPARRQHYRNFGRLAVSRLQQACLAYNGKLEQVCEIRRRLDASRLLVVEYEKMLDNPDEVLSSVFAFFGIPYSATYAEPLKRNASGRVGGQSSRERAAIGSICQPVYERVRANVVGG